MEKYISKETIDKIERLSKGDAEVPVYQKIIKLGEESGEIAEAFIDIEHHKPDSIKEVVEECCDVMNVAIDILNCYNVTLDLDTMYAIEPDNSYHHMNILKLISESGKVSQYFLRLDGAKNVSKSADSGVESLTNQVIKVIYCAHTIITNVVDNYKIDPEFPKEIFAKKLNKWEVKQIKYNGQI